MDDLNNKQMVLLTMFTSFVTSIGTGIITVAMLQEAPPTLTQTVNHVVERTIERVVTGTSTSEKAAPPTTSTTKEITVYAKEDDLVVAAVEKNQSRMAGIYFPGTATSSDPDLLGFVISRDGLIVVETQSLAGSNGFAESYTVRIGAKMYTASLTTKKDDPGHLVAFLKVTLAPDETLDAVSFGHSGSTKLAQTVVLLGGFDGSVVTKATLSKLHTIKESSLTASTTSSVAVYETAPKISDQNVGALAVNLDGQAIGIIVRDDLGKSQIYPVSRILELIGVSPKSAASGRDSTASSPEKNVARVIGE